MYVRKKCRVTRVRGRECVGGRGEGVWDEVRQFTKGGRALVPSYSWFCSVCSKVWRM